MSSAEQFDSIIIGSGQAATALAAALTGAGQQIALIEREHVGGTCINEGCTPTKTMVASARVAYLAQRGADYGVNTGEISIDMERVRERKRSIVESFNGSSQSYLEEMAGTSLIFGEARFTGPQTIVVARAQGDERHMTAERIFLNVGARPIIPPIDGMDSVPYLDSTSIMELDHVPDHLIVLGGGYIGLEFGQMFRRFGSEVTVVQRGGQLAPREDEDVAAELTKILRQDGIDVRLNTSARQVEQSSDGSILLSVLHGGMDQVIGGSHLLVATGRKPNSDLLNLEAAGIATDRRGHIIVNERLETNVPGVYALGDVKGGPAFTHISYDDSRVVTANLLRGGDATYTQRMVPYTMFTDPQLGRIGMSENEARKAGKNIRVASIPMTSVARALEMDEPRGIMKAVIDADTDQILGAAILGIEGGEIASLIQVAMMGNVPYTALRDGVFSHPTLSEAMNTLFAAVE